MEQPVTVTLEASQVVQITEDHGGYLSGRCLACSQGGWIDGRLGYHANAPDVPGNKLKHARGCPVNKYALKENQT